MKELGLVFIIEDADTGAPLELFVSEGAAESVCENWKTERPLVNFQVKKYYRQEKVDAKLAEAAKLRCEWCARGWEFDIFNEHPKDCPCHWCRQPEDLKLLTRPLPNFHVNEDRSVFHICDALDIRQVAANLAKVKP